MRFCLDARTATAHFPGIGRYVVNLAQAMIPLLGQDERLIFLRDPTKPSRWDLTALAGERVQVVDVPCSPFSLRQQWAVPRLLARLRADLYHSPYYLMPYRPGLPTVVTMYDLIPVLFPQQVSIPARLLFRWMTALALRAASRVIVISQATRRDLLTFYRLPPQKVMAIPLAADPAFSPQSPAEIERVRRKYALPEHYLLYLGINKPHKNLTRLLEAWAQVTQHAIRNTLVVAGAWDPRYPEPQQRAETLGLENIVRFLGPVPEADLPALYSAATLFVFPSLYEGFGLPVLEAMACGTPVVCSNTSSLPEVAGDAAIMVNPLDVDELAAAMERVLMDQALREEMTGKGRAQAGRFSWERTARETLQVYESVGRGRDQRFAF
jgi:glycosyltransferase involved in cell wall biosynthesis